ncbi:MAG: hypothetical protein ACD_15C00101G0001 [uncultured bacterium]|nr:MAG: hypothetical protein ACD_15C00101G0001 [uncultured bacterium]
MAFCNVKIFKTPRIENKISIEKILILVGLKSFFKNIFMKYNLYHKYHLRTATGGLRNAVVTFQRSKARFRST